MKICTVVGARPQFIKAATISRIIKSQSNIHEVIIHTGQHFDENMSEVFFEEMDIPKPVYNLGISGKSHAAMTGEMLIQLERLFLIETPDLVLVYGDTNSTLAAALAAVKLRIPICHIEAGNRLGTLNNPEEVNRILTDHISTILCACVESSMEHLQIENLGIKSYMVGDPMYDAFKFYSEKSDNYLPTDISSFDGMQIELPSEYYYMTCHREENTSKIETLKEILDAVETIDAKCIYPVHPRNREAVIQIANRQHYQNIVFCNPIGYLSSIYLVNHAKKIITDSGGLQREAFFAHKPCVTVFDYVVWPETMYDKANQLAKADKNDILNKLSAAVHFNRSYQPFGDGHAAEKIIDVIKNHFNIE